MSNEAKTITQGWAATYRIGECGTAKTEWKRIRTREEEDTAIEAVGKKAEGYVRRQLYLILHDFGYPGDQPFMHWIRSEMEEKASLEADYQAQRESLAAREQEIGELRARIAELEAPKPAPKKRVPRSKAKP